MLTVAFFRFYMLLTYRAIHTITKKLCTSRIISLQNVTVGYRIAASQAMHDVGFPCIFDLR
jgi:hypothetical protein